MKLAFGAQTPDPDTTLHEKRTILDRKPAILRVHTHYFLMRAQLSDITASCVQEVDRFSPLLFLLARRVVSFIKYCSY